MCLKHLGPHGLQIITYISNNYYPQNTIPHIGKQRIIITIPKPNKVSHNLHHTDMPQSLHTIQTHWMPHTPTLLHISICPAHNMDSNNYTCRTCTTLIQQIPPYHALLVTLDISQAFDTIPRHKLINKIFNTQLRNSPNS